MTVNRRISVAPMMDWTDRHDRYFLRQISRHALLYTEMVTTGAIIHGGAARHLRYNTAEHPVALQLGGSNPDDLARACEIANDYAYDEINLNCGCPSDRVQNGAFGACLMATPDVVANCVSVSTIRKITHRLNGLWKPWRMPGAELSSCMPARHG